ncbi:GntR family transcriptional regulator [Haloactinospora alba]|uniref:GntR family transcriptional regulator n=1 Tax=Haloactinospora alba TaxID=405555 RepID=A0A543N944_9ACTN|nr:GntR family transcriptional regulator [Haloactinospora alba]TQN28320.1 GntR family transcriptional regulator [Haloactinospora alba]
MSIDRSASRPLHAQIADTLRAEIRDHVIAPGDTLPSEQALRERFGISRSVVRQALATLDQEGTVQRVPGRAPVAAASVEHRRLVQRVTGLFDQFSRSGLRLSTRVVRLEDTSAPARVAHQLGTREVLRLERVRSVENEPLSYVRTWLPADRTAGLTTGELTDASLHQVLVSRFGIRLVSGRRQIRAVPADTAIARELDTAPSAPLLLLEGSSLDAHGTPVEWFESWHRSDRVTFDVEADEATEQLRLQPDQSVLGEPRDGSGAPADELRHARELAEQLRDELDRLTHRGEEPPR